MDRGEGYRPACGKATLDFMVNCGHVSFDGVDWHAAMLSTEMMAFLDRVGRARRPPR
jgi:hypothetical protein